MVVEHIAAWPLTDGDLQPPAIGSELAAEVHATCPDDWCRADCRYWSGRPDEWLLLDTSTPGELDLELNSEYPNVDDMDWSVREHEETGA